jgi:hypothetical protein
MKLWSKLCDYLLIKNSFVNSNDFWNWKIWIRCLTKSSQNGKIYMDSHSKFAIGIQYIYNVIQYDKLL